jgi:hypothetical protein
MIEGSNPDPGGPKTYGSYGSGSATLAIIYLGRYYYIAFMSFRCHTADSKRLTHFCCRLIRLQPTHHLLSQRRWAPICHTFILSFLYVAGAACPQSLPIRGEGIEPNKTMAKNFQNIPSLPVTVAFSSVECRVSF